MHRACGQAFGSSLDFSNNVAVDLQYFKIPYVRVTDIVEFVSKLMNVNFTSHWLTDYRVMGLKPWR